MIRVFNAFAAWLLKDDSKLSTRKLLVFIVVIFALSRIFFYWSGINFYHWSGRLQMQFIDPDLLKNNLLQSILYLHAQPPLFQFIVGSIYKFFPDNYALVFHTLYLVLGLILTASLFLVMKQLRIPKYISAVFTIFFILSPSALLFENLLLYTYFVAALLCLSALFLYKFLENHYLRYGILFFTCLSFIVLMRSLFHLLWFIVFVLILLVCKRNIWKKIILASCIPFLLIVVFFAKNAYYFGSFSGSTWFGMSFCKMTTFMLSDEEKIQLVMQGKISELSLLPSFRGLWYY